AKIVCSASVYIVIPIISTPDNHLIASRYCRVKVSGRGRVSRAGSCPTVQVGTIPAATVKRGTAIPSTPDNHFPPAPDCCLPLSAPGVVVDGCGSPITGA